MPAPTFRRLESVGLVALDLELRDGFVGVGLPSANQAHRDGADLALLQPAELRIRVTPTPKFVPILGVHSDPFPARPRGERFHQHAVDDVLSALEVRQPRSHRVAPVWHTDRRAVRALDEAFRRGGVVAPVLPPDDDAPPTEDRPELVVATTERAIWPDEPRSPPAPEPLPIETAEAGSWFAPRAWPAVLLELLRYPEESTRQAVRAAAERLEGVGDTRRALIAWAALGDDGARERIIGAALQPLLPQRPVSTFATEAAEHLRALLEPLTDLEASGRRLELAAALEAIAVAEADAQIAELAATVRGSLALPRSLILEVNGEEHRLVLLEAPVLGRAPADVVVAGALVSRRQLGLRRVDGVPIVTDLGSHNGTEIESGGRLTGAVAITGELRLRLGGRVPCSLAPHPFGVALDAGGLRRVLTLGPLAFGAITLAARSSAVVCTGASGLAVRRAAASFELAVGDVVGTEGVALRVLPAFSA